MAREVIGNEEEIMAQLPPDVLQMFTDASRNLPTQSARLGEMVSRLWDAWAIGDDAFNAHVITFKRELESLPKSSLEDTAAKLRTMMLRLRSANPALGKSTDGQ